MATSKTLAPTNVTISIPAMTDQPNASVLANCADKEADAINALNSQLGNIGSMTTILEENASIGTTYASTGLSFTLQKTSIVTILQSYTNSIPIAVGVKLNESQVSTSYIFNCNGIQDNNVSSFSACGVLGPGTYYVWARAKTAGSNKITVTTTTLKV